MTKNIILIIVAFLISVNLFAQNKYEKKVTGGKFNWSISLQGGALQPVGSFSNLYKTSVTVGGEIARKFSRSLTVFINGQFDFMAAKDTGGLSATYVEALIGARNYFGKGNNRIYVEADAGDYISSYNTDDGYGNIISITNNNFGISGGLGAEFYGGGVSSFFFKAKYHYLFEKGNRSGYIGLYGGVRLFL